MNFSLNKFPVTPAVHESSGIPWGTIVRPYGPNPKALPIIPVEELARCSSCFAYINPSVKFNRNGYWGCCICGKWNKAERYDNQTKRSTKVELREGMIECTVQIDAKDPLAKKPCYIFMIDCSGSREYLENVKMGIIAAVEALPESAMIGLLTFSDRIGIFDLASSEKPHIKFASISEGDGGCKIGLEEIFPLSMFLQEVASAKQNLLVAIETIIGAPSWTSPSGESKKRGFGATLAALIDYLNTFRSGEENLKSRTICFLSGYPNYGVGSLTPKEKSQIPTTEKTLYDDIAQAAVDAGTSFDLVAISDNTPLELEALSCLSRLTGGSIFQYDLEHAPTLPQDLHRRLSQPHCFSGLLRLRTSNSFQIASSFGNLCPVAEHENMYKINGCDSSSCFGFGFEFAPSMNFEDYTTFSDIEFPTVQMAFAYYYLPPASEGAKQELQKRLRLSTTQVKIAATVTEMFESIDTGATISLLAHKILRYAHTKGIEETRLLLQDWVTMLIVHYHENSDRYSHKKSKAVDLSLMTHSRLQLLLRAAFGFLKSEFFHPTTTSDRRAFLVHFYKSLPPLHLATLFYPNLFTYSSFQEVSGTNLQLSRKSIVANGTEIVLVDALTKVLVYYGLNSADLPRPPKDSRLDLHLSQLKTSRQVVPQILYLKGGTVDAWKLDAILIEDESLYPGAGTLTASFETFIEQLALEAQKELKL